MENILNLERFEPYIPNLSIFLPAGVYCVLYFDLFEKYTMFAVMRCASSLIFAHYTAQPFSRQETCCFLRWDARYISEMI